MHHAEASGPMRMLLHQNFSLQYEPLRFVSSLCNARTDTDLPQILDTNPSLFFHLQQQKLIELIRLGRVPEALQFAQDELAPRGEESPQFLSELEKTMALLAFDSTTNMPTGVAELLSPAQRMKTAGEVNATILGHLGQGRESKMVGLLKLLCWGEATLDEHADFPRVSYLMAKAWRSIHRPLFRSICETAWKGVVIR
jgi:hypothetical protein